MKIKVLSSLAKVFEDEIFGGYETDSISCLKNERASFQIAVMSEDDDEVVVNVAAYADNVNPFWIKSVPAGYCAPEERDDYYIKNASSGSYPDVLIPIDGKVSVSKGKWQGFWFEFEPDGQFEAGRYDIKIEICGKESETVTVAAEIADAVLPKQSLVCTHWFHSDCLASVYDVDVFSEEYWRIVENFMKEAVRHGTNVILTPLFTPPLDTAVGGERPTVQLVDVKKHGYTYTFGFDKLQRWIDAAKRSGMEYFEMSHLFTQWGAKHAPKIMAETSSGYKRIFGWETRASGQGYLSFLRQFAPELIKFIKANGIEDRVIFHTSDEPCMKDFFSYRKASSIIKDLFGEFYITDALSEILFYKKGLISHPVTNIMHIEDFVGKVPDLWTYYCCNPCVDYKPNRFLAMPSLRNRILGFIMYKYDIKGFLHWGYNFYFTQYSTRKVDPFAETDAGGNFPAGDSYVVYPAPDGTPYDSLRLKVFYEAVGDFEALRLLEKKIGRENTLKILEDGLDKPITACDYPHSEEWLLNKRREINRMLSEK